MSYYKSTIINVNTYKMFSFLLISDKTLYIVSMQFNIKMILLYEQIFD